MPKTVFTKAVRKETFDFFVNYLQSCTKPVHFERLRTESMDASPSVRAFIREKCDGDDLLNFFIRRKTFFIVKNSNVSLKKGVNLPTANKPEHKVKTFGTSFDSSDITSVKNDQASSSKKSSSSESSVDFNEDNAIDHFLHMFRKYKRVEILAVDIKLLPKPVMKYLDRYYNGKLKNFFKDFPDEFILDGKFVHNAIASSRSTENTFNVCVSNIQLIVKLPIFVQKPCIYLLAVKFVQNLLRKHASRYPLNKLRDELHNEAPKEVREFIKFNYSSFKQFLVEMYPVFIILKDTSRVLYAEDFETRMDDSIKVVEKVVNSGEMLAYDSIKLQIDAVLLPSDAFNQQTSTKENSKNCSISLQNCTNIKSLEVTMQEEHFSDSNPINGHINIKLQENPEHNCNISTQNATVTVQEDNSGSDFSNGHTSLPHTADSNFLKDNSKENLSYNCNGFPLKFASEEVLGDNIFSVSDLVNGHINFPHNINSIVAKDDLNYKRFEQDCKKFEIVQKSSSPDIPEINIHESSFEKCAGGINSNFGLEEDITSITSDSQDASFKTCEKILSDDLDTSFSTCDTIYSEDGCEFDTMMDKDDKESTYLEDPQTVTQSQYVYHTHLEKIPSIEYENQTINVTMSESDSKQKRSLKDKQTITQSLNGDASFHEHADLQVHTKMSCSIISDGVESSVPNDSSEGEEGFSDLLQDIFDEIEKNGSKRDNIVTNTNAQKLSDSDCDKTDCDKNSFFVINEIISGNESEINNNFSSDETVCLEENKMACVEEESSVTDSKGDDKESGVACRTKQISQIGLDNSIECNSSDLALNSLQANVSLGQNALDKVNDISRNGSVSGPVYSEGTKESSLEILTIKCNTSEVMQDEGACKTNVSRHVDSKVAEEINPNEWNTSKEISGESAPETNESSNESNIQNSVLVVQSSKADILDEKLSSIPTDLRTLKNSCALNSTLQPFEAKITILTANSSIAELKIDSQCQTIYFEKSAFSCEHVDCDSNCFRKLSIGDSVWCIVRPSEMIQGRAWLAHLVFQEKFADSNQKKNKTTDEALHLSNDVLTDLEHSNMNDQPAVISTASGKVPELHSTHIVSVTKEKSHSCSTQIDLIDVKHDPVFIALQEKHSYLQREYDLLLEKYSKLSCQNGNMDRKDSCDANAQTIATGDIMFRQSYQ